MIFRRPSVRYSKTPEPVTPYQKAAQVWDERIGSARVQARTGCTRMISRPTRARWRSMTTPG